MIVKIYSREAIESIIAEGSFPRNTAVISFYDPAIKRIDKDYTHVDYSGVCDDVFYSELDDLDLEVLGRKGYTYDTYFPEADELAAFIVRSYMERKNIICQCEYGQSRSAGCAAAILEYFYGNGISVFADYNYYPNQVVFHKVYDALVRINPMYSNSLYPENKTDKFSEFTTGAATLYSKMRIERKLTEQGRCFHSLKDAFYTLRHGIADVYVSLHIDDAKVCHGTRMGEHNVGVKTFFNYGNKEVPLIIYVPKPTTYGKPKDKDYYLGKEQRSIAALRRFGPISLDVFGIMEMDGGESVIDKAIVTNICYKEKSKNGS